LIIPDLCPLSSTHVPDYLRAIMIAFEGKFYVIAWGKECFIRTPSLRTFITNSGTLFCLLYLLQSSHTPPQFPSESRYYYPSPNPLLSAISCLRPRHVSLSTVPYHLNSPPSPHRALYFFGISADHLRVPGSPPWSHTFPYRLPLSPRQFLTDPMITCSHWLSLAVTCGPQSSLNYRSHYTPPVFTHLLHTVSSGCGTCLPGENGCF